MDAPFYEDFTEEGRDVVATAAMNSPSVPDDFRFTDFDNSADRLSVEDLLIFVYPEEAGSPVPGNNDADDFWFTDFDVSADGLSVEDLLTFVYPEEGVQAK